MPNLLVIPNDPTSAYHRSSEEDFLAEVNPKKANGDRFFDEVRFLNWKDEVDCEYHGVRSHALLKNKQEVSELLKRMTSGEIPFSSPAFEPFFRNELRDVSAAIDGYKPDVVRTFNTHFATELGAIVAEDLGVPLVVSAHDPTRITDAIKSADRLVCESHELIDTCGTKYGIDQGKMTVIHNPIDMTVFRPYSDEEARGVVASEWFNAPYRVLSVSRLVYGKNTEGLLEALANMKSDYPGLVHYHFGTGTEEKTRETEALRDSLGLEGISFFKGGVQKSDLPAYYSSADVFTLPTLWEGLSRSIREALASGTPAVTTNYGSSAEIVQDGHNGVSIDPTSAEDIERGLRTYFEDGELRDRVDANARPSVLTKYDAKSSMRMHCDNYDKALDQF